MILVVDIGTTSTRVAAMTPDGELRSLRSAPTPPRSPFPGLVEFDPVVLGTTLIDLATSVINDVGAVTAVGITAQRASTVVWERASGQPIGPGLGWQDLRTVGDCLTIRAEHGVTVAPNQSATKAKWLLDQVDGARSKDLCVGTIDSWAAWVLSGGDLHATDHSHAAITGWLSAEQLNWDHRLCELFSVPPTMLPRIVDSVGEIGEASALPGAPMITALIGDQQASLAGQACVRPGDAKITFGTGGMLDVCTGADDRLLRSGKRGSAGCFGIVAWTHRGTATFGAEAIMLSAGSNVDWLRDDLGLVADSEQTHDLAARCTSTDGVVFVPAPLGLGTPHWDYGARGSLFGITRGTTSAHVVRAVLEGVAHRGADLVEAAEADTGVDLAAIRLDGGMSRNPTFVQAVADASRRRVEVAPHAESTTVGAGLLAAVGSDQIGSIDDIADLWRPAAVIEPGAPLNRDQWAEAVRRSKGWIPELSALDF